MPYSCALCGVLGDVVEHDLDLIAEGAGDAVHDRSHLAAGHAESEPNSTKVTHGYASLVAEDGGEATPNEALAAPGDSPAAPQAATASSAAITIAAMRAARPETARDEEMVQPLFRHRQADLAVVIKLTISAWEGTLPLMTSLPSMARAGVFMTP